MDSRQMEAFRVLGIPPDSDRDAVVRAYRRLAQANHPDVSNDAEAAERFAAVAAAYQVISHMPRRDDVPVPGPTPRPTPMTTIGGRIHQRPPIVAGPVSVVPPRGNVEERRGV